MDVAPHQSSTAPWKPFSPNPNAHLLRLPKELRDIIYDLVYPKLTTDELFEDIHNHIHLRLALPQSCKQLYSETRHLAYSNGTLLVCGYDVASSLGAMAWTRPPVRLRRVLELPPFHEHIASIKRVGIQLSISNLHPDLGFGPTIGLAPTEAIIQLCVCKCDFQRRTMWWVAKFRTIIISLLQALSSLTKLSVFHCHVARLSLSEMWDAIQFPDVVATMFEGEARYGGPWSCRVAASRPTAEGQGPTCSNRYELRETDSNGDVVRTIELGFWDSWTRYSKPCVRFRRDQYGIPYLV